MVSAIILAPLKTIGISLQLAVKGHRELFGKVFEQTPEGLIKIPTQLTLKDKMNYEMVLKVSS